MRRREFLAKSAKLLAAISALVLVGWLVASLAGLALTPILHEAPPKWAIGILLLPGLVMGLAIPMIPGAIGGIIFPTWPRRAGAAAALLAVALWWLLALLFRPGYVPHMSWLAWIINGAVNLALLAYLGSVGGAFAVAVRAGWREGGSRKSAPAG